MPNPQQRAMVDWLAARTRSYDFAVVFGSYARGEAYRSSDFDVLLIDSRFSGWSTQAESLFPDWPEEFQDLHVVTTSHEEFRERYCDDDPMVAAIARDGFDIHAPFGFLDYVESIDCDAVHSGSAG